ncbi:hypothetical protein EMIHUDRAFT_201673 [Emiliania huxleyi CCMP1516]|uniref:Uncharacterized protein n=2 Tax=Emiliania huxleyi TaxID=2903 RepID=A0A0D3KIE3_EMIH1|nr:hypothetical protein EMIHUDRAFT_201673 [Emiliania huxleyi CCMP1516]EOD35528.1 hypothetical protein EMIHUDRAFT_201673 [Emiliania huxleyi CCMP1516]|eukprot:XP_005787957.1 hypothetical protein EMIHUDRAFT_201673 [Emiliania huxleyi CCMP1516]
MASHESRGLMSVQAAAQLHEGLRGAICAGGRCLLGEGILLERAVGLFTGGPEPGPSCRRRPGLEQARSTRTPSDAEASMLRGHPHTVAIGITGDIALAEVDGPRETVLANAGAFLRQRWPEICDVIVGDPGSLRDVVRDDETGDVLEDRRAPDWNGDRAALEYQGIDPDRRGPGGEPGASREGPGLEQARSSRTLSATTLSVPDNICYIADQLFATTECYTDIADESAGVRAVAVTSRPVLDIDPTAVIAAPDGLSALMKGGGPCPEKATTECYTDIADESAGVRAVTVTSRPVLDIDPTAVIAAPVDAAFDPAMSGTVDATTSEPMPLYEAIAPQGLQVPGYSSPKNSLGKAGILSGRTRLPHGS